jgi:adenine deaminase
MYCAQRSRVWISTPIHVYITVEIITGIGMLFDLVLKNGRVLDGSGNPWFNADVAIKNGRIAKIGQVESGNARASQSVED